MSYQTLYRKFRPLVFDQVVGHNNTIQTLINQVTSAQVAHAYLFTGSHGTGKTATSRILSRAVNCEQPQGANPCNQCPTCQSILNDVNMDVFEMDAASNNGVDDIRELVEIVKFPPSSCRYKVMIIDEVHMLSKGAFNALLKTLEEPPGYMIFILATTEPHKVPATITSRCQRFEFKRIDNAVMLANLQDICQQLNITADETALQLIVRLAEGGLRDAQSLLEQCISYGDQALSYQQVSQIMGRTDDDDILNLASHVLQRDRAAILDELQRHYHSGRDINVLLSELIALFRSAMRYSIIQDDKSVDLPDSELNWLKANCADYSSQVWLNALEHLLEADAQVRYAAHPWTALELVLLKTHSDKQSLLQRIEALENTITTGAINVQLTNQAAQAVPNSTTNVANKPAPSTPTPQKKQTQPSAGNAGNRPTQRQSPVLTCPDGKLDTACVKQHWSDYLLVVKGKLVSTYAMLVDAQPISYEAGILTIALSDKTRILKGALEHPDNNKNIVVAFLEYFGESAKVNIVVAEQDTRDQQLKTLFKDVVDESKIIIQ